MTLRSTTRLLASSLALLLAACAGQDGSSDATSEEMLRTTHCDETCVVDQFKSLSKVFRPSGDEGAARAWVEQRAVDAIKAKTWKPSEVTTLKDAAGNLLVRIPATGRFAALGLKAVAIQSHLDMILAVDGAPPDAPLEPYFANGVDVVEENGVLHSRDFKTTLGADDGASVAQAVRYILDRSLPHPPLELLFTTSEEIGLVGALALDVSALPLSAAALINMDGGPDTNDLMAPPGLMIGANGGVVTHVDATMPSSALVASTKLLKMSLEGLAGGHSGIDIHESRMNAIRALATLVQKANEVDPGVRLVDVSIGQVAARRGFNKIPSSFEATLALSSDTDLEVVRSELLALFAADLAMYTNETPASVHLTIEPLPASAGGAVTHKFTSALVHALLIAPNGVIVANPDFPSGVERSSNLGVFGLDDATRSKKLYLSFMNRGFELERNAEVASAVLQPIRDAIVAGGGSEPVVTQAAFSPWLIDRQSDIVKVAQKGAPILQSITILGAGNEPGVIAQKYPQLKNRTIGIVGPKVGCHSPQESMGVASYKAQTTAIQKAIEAFGDDPALLH